ncbi:hypothetical protein ACFWBB_29895 [Streptomyces sp. NPDC060000]|uniref:hypothetical protein n=1 Tax=Streptomyces sp. NPDC060000 TaxID=3347031 RepID=UPI00369E21DE
MVTIKDTANAVEVRAALCLGEEHREWTEALERTPVGAAGAEPPQGSNWPPC